MATAVPNQLHIDTTKLLKRMSPSLTSFFSVHINGSYGGVSSSDVNFLAYEAVLPGTSFELGQVFGDRQGITEQYPTKRVYPPIDVSFYVNVKSSIPEFPDKPYPVITFFENWMQQIFELKGTDKNIRYGRFNYPSTYESDIIITKFERDYRDKSRRLLDKGTAGAPQIEEKCSYTLRGAYPTNIISLPVSYSQADVLRTTITFNYDFYSYRPVTYTD